jgi:GNAT superfamily N-acetyltransferase
MNLTYDLLPFESIRSSLQSLNNVKGREKEPESTMYLWTHEPDAIHDIPPVMAAVCFDGDEIVAWAGVGTLGRVGGFGHISSYVAPEYRSQGIATALIKMAVANYLKQDLERTEIVLEMDQEGSDKIRDIVESFGVAVLPYVDDKYDYANDEIWDGKNPKLLAYHKYLSLKVIDCECEYCSDKKLRI